MSTSFDPPVVSSDEPLPASPDDVARLHVQGNGPPLVYIPGIDGTGLLFYRQTRLLSHRFRIITFRLRDDATSMESLVEDVSRHLDRVVSRGEKTVVVGESFGGALSMRFALAHPERISRMVILNSFTRVTPPGKLNVAIAGMHVVPWRTMQIVRRLTASRLHSAHTHRDEIKRFLLLTSATTREGYLNRLRILTRYDMRPDLHALHVPTLYLAADEDHLIPSVREAKYMAARVPNARLRVLHGHGHGCFLAPDMDLNALLHEWEAESDPEITRQPENDG